MATVFFIVAAFAAGYVARIVRPVRLLIGLNPVVKSLQATIDGMHARLEEIERANAKPPASPPA